MLADIELRGEAAVREYASTLDRWTGEIVVSPEEIERRTRDIPASVKRDIEFATAQVRRFAQAQRESIHEFAIEIQPGLIAGQRLDPGQCRRLLCADRPLRAHRVGVHEHRDREGGRRADRRRVLDAVQGRRRSIRRCCTR